MKMPVVGGFLLCTLGIFTGCQVLNNSSKYSFVNGYYFSRLNAKKAKKYYVLTGGDSVKVYPRSIARLKADTVKSLTVLFPPDKKPSAFSAYSFRAESFDLDVLTIVFKYRPAVMGFPNQLNTNFNGAVYGGYRTDIYKLAYKETPFHTVGRKITHYGYSAGGFAGIGTSRIDEYVTLGRIDYEYDGAVITTGLAAVFGLNKLNFGFNCGFDFLMDKNKHVWVNEGKPWLGLSVGLNLN